MINKIVVAGGGFAGYITALLVKKLFCDTYHPLCEIEIIESSKIGTVGVGEAVSQHIPDLLSTLEINPWQFINACNGTFKISGRFDNWNYEGEQYHHPLIMANQVAELPIPNIPEYHLYFLAKEIEYGDLGFSNLAEAGKIPFKKDKKNKDIYVPAEIPKSYTRLNPLPSMLGVHMEAQDSVDFLRKTALERGITVSDSEIIDWKLEPDTDYLKTLILKNGREVNGDFFFDCTGFRRLIFGQTYKEEYIDYSKYIPQNSVSLAREINNKNGTGIPYKEGEGPWPFSIFDAQKNGWMFKIPLQHRIGSGYVYSDKLVDDDTIKQEQIKYWKDRGYDVESVRTLKWKPGKFKRTVMKNCFAMGLSEGFTDPLDGGALIVGLNSLEKFIRQMTPFMPFDRYFYNKFNEESIKAYEWVIEFVCFCHLQKRSDSEYWRYFKEDNHIPFELSDKLLQWSTQPARSDDFEHKPNTSAFNMGSWLTIGQKSNYIGTASNAEIDIKYYNVNEKEMQKLVKDIKYITSKVEKHSVPMMDVLNWSHKHFKQTKNK